MQNSTPPGLTNSESIKIMKRFFTLSILLIFGFSALSQSGAVKGSIYSDNQEPIAGITISLEGASGATATDNDGSFYFTNILPGTYTVVASGIGYSARSQSISVTAGKTTTANFQLDTKANVLQEIVVSTRHRIITTSSSTITRTNTPLEDIPQNIQFVDRATINEQQLFTVDQALKNVAGVNLASNYGAINIRGFNTNAGSFLTNGMKGQPYPEGVLPLLGNVESIEVIHGATAILYGQGSVGGNINLVTKQPKKETNVHASVSGGSFDLVRGMADVTGSINKSRSLYFLAGVAYQNGGRFTDHFDNENLQLYGSLRWDISAKTNVQVNGNYVRDRSTSNWGPEVPVMDGLPLFSLPPEFSFAGTDARYEGDSYQLQAIFNHTFSKAWKATLLFGATQTKAYRKAYNLSWEYDPVTTALGRTLTIQTIKSPTTTINPYVTGEFKIGRIKNSLTTGLDINFNRSDYPGGFKYYPADPFYLNAPDYSPWTPVDASPWSSRTELFRYNIAGAYVQDQLEIIPKLKALIGLRYNNYFMRYYADDENHEPIYDERPEVTESLTPRAGIVYQPFKNTSLYIDYNQGFIPQYSNERKFGGPFDPEISHQFELGYKGTFINNHLNVNVAAYHINKTNVLVYYEDSTLPLGYGLRPLQKVTSKGVEVSLSGHITKGFFAILNYSYNDTKISESNVPEDVGSNFYNSPPNTANGWLSYTFSSVVKGLTLGFGVNYIDKRTAYFGELPRYTTADAMIGYKYKNYSLQVNANNLFNKQYAQSGNYVDYAPGAPRNFLVTFTYALK